MSGSGLQDFWMVIMTWFWSFEHGIEITNPKKQITNKFKIRKINDRNDCGFGHSKLVNVIYLEFGTCVLVLPINVRICRN